MRLIRLQPAENPVKHTSLLPASRDSCDMCETPTTGLTRVPLHQMLQTQKTCTMSYVGAQTAQESRDICCSSNFVFTNRWILRETLDNHTEQHCSKMTLSFSSSVWQEKLQIELRLRENSKKLFLLFQTAKEFLLRFCLLY